MEEGIEKEHQRHCQGEDEEGPVGWYEGVDVSVAGPVGHPPGGIEGLKELQPVGPGHAQEEETSQDGEVVLGFGYDVKPVVFHYQGDGLVEVVGNTHHDEDKDHGVDVPVLEDLIEGEFEDIESHILAEYGIGYAKGGAVEELEDGLPGVDGA